MVIVVGFGIYTSFVHLLTQCSYDVAQKCVHANVFEHYALRVRY